MKTFTILLTLHLIVLALTDTETEPTPPPTVFFPNSFDGSMKSLQKIFENKNLFNLIPKELRNSITYEDVERLLKNHNDLLEKSGVSTTEIPAIFKNYNNIETESTEPSTTKEPTTESSTISNKVSNNKTDCIQSKTISSKSGKICQGQLIFEETFQANQLDSKIWSKEIRIPSDYDDGDFISYQDLPENCYIKNNHLYIVPTLLENTNDFNVARVRNGVLDFDKRCTAVTSNHLRECNRTAGYQRILPPVVSARIGTREKFSFQYGRIEIKAKLPKGDWLFPQLLLEPYSTRAYGDKGYASGQIRIAFNRGNTILTTKDYESIDGFRLYGGVVVTAGAKLREKFLINKLQRHHLSDDFHIYSMIWTNESVTFEFDGIEYGKINGGFGNHPDLSNLKVAEKWRKGDFMAPFDCEFFISLGVSAGGISDFPDNSINGGNPKPWKNGDPKAELKFWNDRTNWFSTWNGEDAGLKVDYIRVWAL